MSVTTLELLIEVITKITAWQESFLVTETLWYGLVRYALKCVQDQQP